MPLVRHRRTRKVAALEFGQLMEGEHRAEAEAERILSRARDKADRIVADAEDRADRRERALRRIAEGDLKTYFFADRIDRNAAQAARALAAIDRIRADHAALVPWLVPLVRDCIHRILGTFEDTDIIARQVALAVETLGRDHRLTLRSAPETLQAVRSAMDEDADSFAAIDHVGTDSRLDPGAIIVEGRLGRLTLDLPTQIEALLGAIEDAMTLDDAPAPDDDRLSFATPDRDDSAGDDDDDDDGEGYDDDMEEPGDDPDDDDAAGWT